MIDKIARKYDGQPGGGMRFPPMGGPPSASKELLRTVRAGYMRLIVLLVAQCVSSELLADSEADRPGVVDIKEDRR